MAEIMSTSQARWMQLRRWLNHHHSTARGRKGTDMNTPPVTADEWYMALREVAEAVQRKRN